VGTSRRVVRKVTSLTGDPGRPELADSSVSASVPESESFIESSRWRVISGDSERATTLRLGGVYDHLSRFHRALGNVAGPASTVLPTAKLYGFPSVFSAPWSRHPILRLRSFRKPHALPRAREAIPSSALEFGSIRDSDWPGCNLRFYKFCAHLKWGSHGI